jgi:hypothetical protein
MGVVHALLLGAGTPWIAGCGARSSLVDLAAPIEDACVGTPAPWVRRLGGSGSDVATDLAVDQEGRTVVAVLTGEEVADPAAPFDPPNRRAVRIASLEPDACVRWDHVFEASSGVAIARVGVRNGEAVVVLKAAGTIDLGGGEIGTSDGEDGEGPGPMNVLVAKFDGDGEHGWGKQLTGSAIRLLSSPEIDSTGAVYLAGQFRGDVGVGAELVAQATPGIEDDFLLRLEPDGTPGWLKTFKVYENPANEAQRSLAGLLVDGEDVV